MRLFPVSAAHRSVQATFCFLSFGSFFFVVGLLFLWLLFLLYVGIFSFAGRLFADQINCLIMVAPRDIIDWKGVGGGLYNCSFIIFFTKASYVLPRIYV